MRKTKFLKSFINKVSEKREEGKKNTIDLTTFRDAFPELTESELSEVTYYTCLKVLTESLGKLSIHLYDSEDERVTNHDAVDRINGQINPFMTSIDFLSLMEFNRNHHGNAYAYLSYGRTGELLGIYPLDPKRVTVWVDNVGLFQGRERVYYEYEETNGKSYYFQSSEILHLKGGLSKNGIVGVSVRETLATTIKGAHASQRYLNSLYERGLTAKSILRYTGDLNEELQSKLLSKMERFTNFNSNGSNIIPLPPGMDLIPLDLKLTDSQFFELKRYKALEIAAAFGVKPNHLNDYTKSSYSSSQEQNLSFYTETLLIILIKYEKELDLKLLTAKERAKGYSFSFNVSSMLKASLETQARCLQIYVSSGVYTINEARKKLKMPPIEGGDVVIVNGSYVKLSDVGIAYDSKGGAK